jgi:OmpA-OmpF porin, OOP family
MKQKLAFTLALAILVSGAFAQKMKRSDRYPSAKKGSLFGMHFNLSDFKTAAAINATSLNDVLKKKDWKQLSNMNGGFSLAYWKGLTKTIDFSTKLNVVFSDFSANYNNEPGKTEVGLELEPTLNFRPMNDNHLFAPFITAGIGAGMYTGRLGMYIPVGVGVQCNLNSVTYLFLQSQYKVAVTDKVLGDNLFYSFGIAENFAEPKVKTPPPPPPMPVVEKKDRDNDGIEDDKDACPDAAGKAALNGCPDKDNDGIADKDDKCPDVAGTAKYNGCPIPDGDGDGVNDENDKCPTVAGLARYQGCPIPDGDSDGVNDEEDKCPTEPGVASNAGCPEIKQEVVDKVNMAAKNIFFATGSSKLLPKSFASLNNVAKILKDNPSYIADISGHTDNTGTPEKNTALSAARAEAVAAYLKSKGVAENQITAEGMGQDNPVADNKTAAGRAKNRRVEMKIRNY